MNRIKKITLKFVLLLIVLYFLDFLIGYGLERLYFNQSQGKLYNITHTLEQQTADILIFGSSRAMHHYNPEIISDSLQMSCFNAGYDGQSILYHKALLDVLAERYTPKIIILDVNSAELDTYESSYDLLSVLNPYVRRNPILWNTLKMRSPFEKCKYLSKIYPYNSLLTRMVMGNMHIKTKDVSDNGFTARSGIWQDSMQVITYNKNVALDNNKFKSFNQFVEECKNKNIQLYVLFSPAFEHAENTSLSIDSIRKVCERENIPYISYQNDKNYMSNELFLDPGHLNDVGADLFSSDVAHLLLPRQ